MPDQPPNSGEFDSSQFFSAHDRVLRNDYEMLMHSNAATIDGFSDFDNYAELSLRPSAELVLDDDPHALLLRRIMLKELGVPYDSVVLKDLDLGWKKYSDCIHRLYAMPRQGKPDVTVKVRYIDDEVAAVFLLGTEQAKKELRHINYSAEERKLDKLLAENLGFTTDEIEELTLENEGLTLKNKQMLSQTFNQIHTTKTTPIPGFSSTELMLRRSDLLRRVMPIKGSADQKEVQNAADEYWSYIMKTLGDSTKIDKFTYNDMLKAERTRRVETLDKRLRRRRTLLKDSPRLGAAVMLIAAGGMAGRGVMAGLDHFTGTTQNGVSFGMFAGSIMTFASLARRAKPYITRRNQTPTFKTLEPKTGIQQQLQQEFVIAEAYTAHVDSL